MFEVSNYYRERVDRNVGIYGWETQEKIYNSTAIIVGNGGMGNHMAVTAARYGFGHIVVADSEVHDVSNINRQGGAYEDTVGRSKAECAYEMIKRVVGDYDDVRVEVFSEGITRENMHQIMACGRGRNCVIFDAVEFFAVAPRIWTHQAARAECMPLINCNVVSFGSRIFYFEPDGMTMEEMLDMDDSVHPPLSEETKLRLMQRLVPRWPQSITQKVIEDWILGLSKAPIISGTPLISAGISMNQFVLRLIGIKGRPWVKLIPPMAAYGWFDEELGMAGGIEVGKWW